jgi:hypothetical protein
LGACFGGTIRDSNSMLAEMFQRLKGPKTWELAKKCSLDMGEKEQPYCVKNKKLFDGHDSLGRQR